MTTAATSAVSTARLDLVKDRIARAMLDVARAVPESLGGVTLRPHQLRAAERLVKLIERHGGALLAEPVGVGKTFTALAAAAEIGGAMTIVAPSSLRAMWREALERCGVVARVLTHEALSRGLAVAPVDGIVIVDEAHRARSPTTRRYAALAELCRRARVILVTATPVQNHRGDLAAQLSLYLGARAWQLSDDELAAHVVRGSDTAAARLPRVDGPVLVELSIDADFLDQLLALPAPVPARDESLAHALLLYGLLHQWSSSRAALVAALKRRRARGVALLDALSSGRHPTGAELAAWTYADDAVQLAFPEIVAPSTEPRDESRGEIMAAVERHATAVEAMLAALRESPDPDDERADALRRIRRAHPGARIIAFCHYAETVDVLWRKLRTDGAVAALTAQGARVAGGRVTRAEVLAQFTPGGRAEAEVPRAERIDLLLTTDLLSEGLNLQEASVVVHLDLPWNPARLDQRVGRVRRFGSRFESVGVYTIAPPAPAARLLRITERLRDKLALASRTVGVVGGILPRAFAADGDHHDDAGLAEQRSAIDRALRAWLCTGVRDSARPANHLPIVAATLSPHRGFFALSHQGKEHEYCLVADDGRGISTSPSAVLGTLAAIGCTEVEPEPAFAAEVLARLERWLAVRRGADAIDLGSAAAARCRRATLARVAQVLARAPRHRRAQLAPLADVARSAAVAPLGAGAERVLDNLARAELPDEAWLRSVATFASLHARAPEGGPGTRGRDDAVLEAAIILLQPAAL